MSREFKTLLTIYDWELDSMSLSEFRAKTEKFPDKAILELVNPYEEPACLLVKIKESPEEYRIRREAEKAATAAQKQQKSSMESRYTYDIQHIHFNPDTGIHTEVQLDTKQLYGWFEAVLVVNGKEDRHLYEGGLWFEHPSGWRGPPELVDYQGVFELPKTVAWILRQYGFIVGPDYTDY